MQTLHLHRFFISSGNSTFISSNIVFLPFILYSPPEIELDVYDTLSLYFICHFYYSSTYFILSSCTESLKFILITFSFLKIIIYPIISVFLPLICFLNICNINIFYSTFNNSNNCGSDSPVFYCC